MKGLIYGSLVVFLAVMSFPITAEAFSRRSHDSEVFQSQQTFNTNQNVSAQSVPEPPALLLMGIGFGVLAVFSAIKRFRKQNA